MEMGLSRGAVAAILASQDGTHAVERPPVLQVAVLRLFSSSGRSTPLYKTELSDGVRAVRGILTIPMNHLVDDGKLRRGTVIRLLKYQGHTIQNRRFFVFVEFEILQTDCAQIEYGEGIEFSSTSLSPAKKNANLTYPEYYGESHSASQGIEAGLVRKNVAEITAQNLDCSDNQEFVIVKATITFINKENLCYAACPLVVNGRQCLMEVTSNGDGWWYCHSCNQTFITSYYSYRILIQFQDSTGKTYAPASQQAGEDIFGRTAKQLYLMKCEKQDLAQFDNIVRGVLFGEFLFRLKVETGAIHDKKFPKCTIVKAERVTPSTESRSLLREINKFLQENSGSAFVRYGTGLPYFEVRQSVQNLNCDNYAMNHGGAWDLVSQTGSNY